MLYHYNTEYNKWWYNNPQSRQGDGLSGLLYRYKYVLQGRLVDCCIVLHSS